MCEHFDPHFESTKDGGLLDIPSREETARAGERRSDADRRQQLPTGSGDLVLAYVREKMGITIRLADLPQAIPDRYNKPKALRLLLLDLEQRSETGAKKYGTPLKTNNGRNATLDLYQELCDGIMYSAQCKLEGKAGGHLYELLVELAAQVAIALEEQNIQTR